ncbi:MAG: uridine kinase [Eubacteriaceae bacterium]|nr:uridine kinase [Eubacteriaceae bacterium]
MHNTIIGIAGGSGSGKTTLAKSIIDRFGDAVALISHDSYYKRLDHLSMEDRARVNYDHPEAYETSLLIEDLEKLRGGTAVDIPVYSFSMHNRTEATEHVEPKKIIIVEGILIFENVQLRDLFDIRIFVDTDADERFIRRLKRDISERGRTLESVEAQYLNTVKPMHEMFVEPTRKDADLIIPGGYNDVVFEMIASRIEDILEEGDKVE